jgi:hypothetical protein
MRPVRFTPPTTGEGANWKIHATQISVTAIQPTRAHGWTQQTTKPGIVIEANRGQFLSKRRRADKCLGHERLFDLLVAQSGDQVHKALCVCTRSAQSSSLPKVLPELMLR